MNIRFIIAFHVSGLFCMVSCAQQKYSLSIERIELKSSKLISLQSDRYYYPVGRDENLLVYQMNNKSRTSFGGLSSEAALKIYYNELTGRIIDSIQLGNKLRKIRELKQLNDVTIFRGFFEVPNEHGNKLIDELNRGGVFLDYQDIWLERNNNQSKLISFAEHYSDKDVEFTIDDSGKYALVSTYLSDYLRSTQADSVISIFSLSDEQFESQEVYCSECIKPQVINEYFYYGKKFYYLEGADVYDWKIYRAPIFDLSKSELLAEYIELISVSPDGKYLLGKKILFGKETLLILDVRSKSFQYILGREYSKFNFFYSPAFKKFAFDREREIIYIEYPDQFPFSSLGSDTKPKRTSNTEDLTFWQKYVH